MNGTEDPNYSCDADDPYAASYLASATGLPEVTFPVGIDEAGLPIGGSFLARALEESLPLSLAASWEEISDEAPRPHAFLDE